MTRTVVLTLLWKRIGNLEGVFIILQNLNSNIQSKLALINLFRRRPNTHLKTNILSRKNNLAIKKGDFYLSTVKRSSAKTTNW